MTRKPDPARAIYLKPNQRTLRCARRRRNPSTRLETHPLAWAIDPWGVAIRTLRKRGVHFE
jgi:hypothetical protein